MESSSQAAAGGDSSGGAASGFSSEVLTLLEAQKQTILAAVNTQIAGLQSTLLEQQANLAQQVVAEAEGESYTFKKKGNEEQHKFNRKVLKANTKAVHALESGNAAKAQDHLKEGIVLLNNRQKLVKLADKSEYGWATIQEYVDDELADNESDAKKIKKAEKRAGVRVKTLQDKKKKSKPNSQPTQSGSSSHVNANSSTSSFFRPQFGRSYYSSSRNNDMCYRCGRRGHWADSCPRNKSTSTVTK